MAAAFPLQTLLDHARHRMQAGERLLLMIRRKEEAARRQLEELETYRREYRQRLAASTQGGMAIQLLRDYHTFLAKLETAIRHQHDEVAKLHARWQAAHDGWLGLRRQVKSYEVLADRHHAQEVRREDRREQGQMDALTERKEAAKRLAEQ
jgi:flagellar FliJ protein